MPVAVISLPKPYESSCQKRNHVMEILYRIYQFIFVLPLGLLITVLCSLGIVICSFCGCTRWGATYIGRFWAWSILRLLLIPITVEGRENVEQGKSYIFMANHQGPFDIFLIYGFLHHEFKWMMKKSLFDIPFVGMACRKAGFISVDKSTRRAVAQTMIEARNVLQGGASLCIFPEGARCFTGHMGFFRRGGFQLADSLQLPIVPMTIDGSFDVLPRQKGFYFVKRHPMRLVIHKPLYPETKGPENVQRMMDESYATIMAALPEHYQGYVENPDQ